MTFGFFFVLHLFLANFRLLILEDIPEFIARSAEIHLHFLVSSMPLHMFALCALGWEESMVSLASGRTFKCFSEVYPIPGHHEI